MYVLGFYLHAVFTVLFFNSANSFFFFWLFIFKTYFFRLNCVTWKNLSDKPAAISFPDISKILQMESIGTASRTVIVSHGSQTVWLPEKDLD